MGFALPSPAWPPHVDNPGVADVHYRRGNRGEAAVFSSSKHGATSIGHGDTHYIKKVGPDTYRLTAVIWAAP